MLRTIYKLLERLVECLPTWLHIIKMWVSEWVAIFSKRRLVGLTRLDSCQVAEINDYWRTVYGRRISSRWHRLYQSINGVFDKSYVPDVLFATRIEPSMNRLDYAKLYSDKGLTELLYAGASRVSFARTILLKAGGYFYNAQREIITYQDAFKALSEADSCVIKPTVGGSSGRSVQVFSTKISDVAGLMSQYGDNYIVQEKLEAHDAYSFLYSESINTLRLITYVSGEKIYHAPVCLRMGANGNKVDNIHSGGLVIGVSDSGMLLDKAYRLGYCDARETFDAHPDSGVQFVGYEVPFIDKVIAAGIELHGMTPKLGIISWDFMIDKDGNVVLVEGNYFGQSIWFPQIAHGKGIFQGNTASVLSIIK